MFKIVGTVAFETFGSINIVDKDSMFLFPIILELGDSGIHVGTLNCNKITSDIK